MPPSADPLHSPADAADPLQHQRAVLIEPGRFATVTHSLSACAPTQVTVRLAGCGVCASSLPVWQGRSWFEYPLAAGVPGHEGWGEIVALGSVVAREVPSLYLGQQVTCLGDGAFSQYLNVAAGDVVPLPGALHGLPFPGEAVGCAMNIFRRARIEPGQTVAIIGAGFLGLLLVQLAASAGARVVAMSRRDSARQLASRFGAAAVYDTDDWWGNARQIVELTGGRGCERVIEVTGMQFALDAATEMAGQYSRLVIAGYHQDGLRTVNMQKWNWQAMDVVNAHERDPRRYVEGMKRAVSETVAGGIQPLDLLTHSFRLDELNEAFQMMIDRPHGFIKGWVRL